MAKGRKIHVQLEFPKLDKNGQRRGGKRLGAGRPAKGPRPSQPHKTRPVITPRHVIHVTLRVADDVAQLRKRDAYHAIRDAMVTSWKTHAESQTFRIVHISIQHGHIHLLVEADDKNALARGMQGFEIVAAKELNAAASKRRGRTRTGTVLINRPIMASTLGMSLRPSALGPRCRPPASMRKT